MTCDDKLLNKEFYTFNREALLHEKPLHLRLSSKNIRYPVNNDELYLKKAHKSITMFAYVMYRFITKEKNAPSFYFPYNSSESFCSLTSNFIQVGLQLLLSKDFPEQLKVDACIGVTFHEKLHKRITAQSIAGIINVQTKNYYTPEATKKIEEFFKTNLPTGLHKNILNILEDRRIESKGCELYPGFGFFLDETRKYAFCIHHKKLENKKTTKELILIDDILYRVLLPELYPLYKSNADDIINGLEIVKRNELREAMSNINAYFLSNFSDIYSSDFTKIVKATKDLVDFFPDWQKEEANKKLGEANGLISKTSHPNLEKLNTKKISEKLKQELEKITKETIEQLGNAEQNNNDDNEELPPVIEKLNLGEGESGLYSQVEIFEAPITEADKKLLTASSKLSSYIKNNIAFLDSRYSKQITEYELTEGEIDEDELYSINHNRHIFLSQEPLATYSLDFGILLDESGSMSYLINDAKTAVLALMLALHKAKHINLFVYGHTANDSSGKRDNIQMFKYYNSLEKKINCNTIYSAKARTNNADGYAILKMGEIMLKSKSKNKILVVASDGQPHAVGYGGDKGIAHVKKSVEELERAGIFVIQICMNFIEESNKMFKHFVQFEPNSNFAKNLSSILLKKLIEFSKEA